MRKLLISVLIFLLLVLAYVVIANGVHLGIIDVYGVKEIIDTNKEIDDNIEQAKKLVETDFAKSIVDLGNSEKKLATVKKDYNQLTSVSTEAQIIQASELEEYEIEFLWAKVGTIATKHGINIKMEVKNSTSLRKSSDGRALYDLYFSTTGSYIYTALFISDLENDSDLEFKIDNFKMENGSSGKVNASFTVTSIAINNLEAVETTTTNTNPITNTNTTNTNTTNTNSTNTNTNTNNTSKENTSNVIDNYIQ